MFIDLDHLKQVNDQLGHAAFFGFGAYAAALFAKLVMPDPTVGLLVAIVLSALLGLVASVTILRGSDLTRLMVTLGTALLLLELANKLDWLTGGADGLQGVVMGPVLGMFEFDLYGRTAAWYSLADTPKCLNKSGDLQYGVCEVSNRKLVMPTACSTAAAQVGVRLLSKGEGRLRLRAASARRARSRYSSFRRSAQNASVSWAISSNLACMAAGTRAEGVAMVIRG